MYELRCTMAEFEVRGLMFEVASQVVKTDIGLTARAQGRYGIF
jgi:hypothetical protein